MRLAALCAFVVFTVSACGTMEGLGRDVSSAGKAIERSADGVQKKM